MRIRTIKPEFWKHDGIAELEYATRLLFIALWCIADRRGRMEDRPKRIKAEGVKAGVPDIFLPVSVGIWSGLFVEMKRTKGGRLTDEQRDFLNSLDPHYIVAIAHGAQDVIDKIRDSIAPRERRTTA